jgi:hypothetical protein
MDSVYPHLVANTETRLLAVTSAASNLLAELDELHELREQLRRAQLSVRTFQRTADRKRARK